MNLLGVENKQLVALAYLSAMMIKFQNVCALITLCMFSKSLLFVFIFKRWGGLRLRDGPGKTF